MKYISFHDQVQASMALETRDLLGVAELRIRTRGDRRLRTPELYVRFRPSDSSN